MIWSINLRDLISFVRLRDLQDLLRNFRLKGQILIRGLELVDLMSLLIDKQKVKVVLLEISVIIVKKIGFLLLGITLHHPIRDK